MYSSDSGSMRGTTDSNIYIYIYSTTYSTAGSIADSTKCGTICSIANNITFILRPSYTILRTVLYIVPHTVCTVCTKY